MQSGCDLLQAVPLRLHAACLSFILRLAYHQHSSCVAPVLSLHPPQLHAIYIVAVHEAHHPASLAQVQQERAAPLQLV